jgi:hypothetical protein
MKILPKYEKQTSTPKPKSKTYELINFILLSLQPIANPPELLLASKPMKLHF